MTKDIRTLTLIRHAKSSWKEPLPDFERPLSKRGKRNAPELGKWLLQNGVSFDHIVCSPARRTMETARLVASELGMPETAIMPDDNIYLASLSTFFDRVRQLDDRYHSIAMVGHNPGISSLANHLLANGLFEDMRTCACVQMRFPVRPWSDVGARQGELVFFHDPRSQPAP